MSTASLNSQVTSEELAMLHEALADFREEFGSALHEASDLGLVLEAYGEHLENILNATLHIGMLGLQRAIETAQINAVSMQLSPETMNVSKVALLTDWIDVALAYLAAPLDEVAAQTLAIVMVSHVWPHPIPESELPAYAEQLQAIEIIDVRADEARLTYAEPAHLDLSVPDDIDRNVLDSLLTELPQHALEFSVIVQRLSLSGHLEDVHHARRVAHTLKGASNTVGVRGVASLTHVLEDILIAFGRHDRVPTREVSDVLIEAADCLEAMSESLLSQGAAPTEGVAVYQKLLDWANRLATEGLPVEDTPLAAFEAAEVVPHPLPMIEAEEPVDDDVEKYLRVPASLVDLLLKLSNENSVITSQLQDRLTQLTEDLAAQRAGSRQIRQLSSELEQLVDIRGMAMLGGGTGELDALEMDQYNELHMLSRRIVESGADSMEFAQTLDREVTSLRDLMAAKERAQIEIQRGIERTRMVPVSSIVPRLQRTVRQTARMLNRSVELVVQGEATLLDAQLLNQIMDPLMHMLRNAVDHGIEPADDRVAARKPSTGTIKLSFAVAGTNISVRCEDDGVGLSLDRVRAKAIERGIIDDQAALTDTQVMRLILLPGFSTREEASLISGRGVGMDVVQRTVTDLRGRLDLASRPGAGMQFDMLFPVQLSATQVMISRSSRHLLAISERNVMQLVPVDQNLLRDDTGRYHYMLQGESVPALRLESLLGLPIQALKHPDNIEVVMIVLDENRVQHAVIAPELNDSRHVVLKPLSELLPSVTGVDGLTILGDGSVATVIDLPDLLRAHQLSERAATDQMDATLPVYLPLCLIVEDSVSVRRTMEQLMQDAGYDVVSARDGIDALGFLQRRRVPDVVLVDLEMPRMDGLQFTSALRLREETKATPVVMITSRSTEKHRQLAHEAGVDAFLTKPYSDEQLLTAINDLLNLKSSR